MDKATGKLVATKEESGDVDLSESETGSEEDVTGQPVANKTAAGGTLSIHKNQTARESPKAEKTVVTLYACLQPQLTIRKQSSRST